MPELFELNFEKRNFLFHNWIPMIFNKVIWSSSKVLSNLGPIVSQLLLKQKEKPFFFLCKGLVVDFRIQIVIPSFPTLFTNSSRNILSYSDPVLNPVFRDKIKQKVILLFGPWIFYNLSISYFFLNLFGLIIWISN